MTITEAFLTLYEACRSENISCPWCSGRIHASDIEHHDDYCPLPALLATITEETK